MPLLEIPHLAGTPCDTFSFSAGIVLSEEELTNLLGALGTENKHIHGATRRTSKEVVEGKLVDVSERFGVDYTGDNEERTKRLVETMKPKGLKGKAAGFLHVDVQLTIFDQRDKRQESSKDDDLVIRFWKWVKARPGGLEISVRSRLSFDPTSHESIIGLPLRAPGDLGVFNSIPGLILAKREGEGADSRILYEVLVRQDDDELSANLHFLGLSDGSPETLKKLLAQVIEVAHFAVHEKQAGATTP